MLRTQGICYGLLDISRNLRVRAEWHDKVWGRGFCGVVCDLKEVKMVG